MRLFVINEVNDNVTITNTWPKFIKNVKLTEELTSTLKLVNFNIKKLVTF